jgi:hypothetical protein
MSGLGDEPLLQFPCDFPIKIMGAGGADFRRLAVDLVRRHASDLDDGRVRIQDSRTGRYQSVTVIVRARDRAQLDAIYRDLCDHPQVTMAL